MATTITLSGGQVLTPDTATTVQHASTAEATSHPVESGAVIADHVIVQPQTIQLTTEWTPRPPMDDAQPVGDERGAVAFDILTRVLHSGATVAIEVDGVLYAPAVLTSVAMPRAFEDGDGRTINLSAQVVQIVAGRTVAARIKPVLKGGSARKRAQAKATELAAAQSAIADTAIGLVTSVMGG